MDKHQTSAIAEITMEDLQPGMIGQLFHHGAKAVHLQHDDRISELWSELVMTHKDGPGRVFWQCSIVDFARNHVAKEMDVGDLFRFCPGLFGHIARKTILYQEAGDQTIQTIPPYFWCEGQREAWPQDLLQMAWELAADIFRSALPSTFEYPQYAVTLELLKYPSCLSEIEHIFDLLADSTGGWTRIGQQLDAYKAMAQGPLDTKGLRDLFAFGSLIPGLRQPLHALNRVFRRFSDHQMSPANHLIGAAHTDTSRAITCIGGDRDRITTEIYDGHQWYELAFTTDSMFIFPADLLSLDLHFHPTVHRYSISKEPTRPAVEKPNITLLLGLVDKNHFQSIASRFR